ncbi:MAG TPA: class I SAM-dependent methyltransferase [Caulobacteraceae bacterium]|nr:class I SAM-dependent methyltransferase [Caulobacteraceae bacterium]
MGAPATSTDAKFQSETQNGTTFTGRLFNLGKSIVSSEFQPHDHLKSFLASAQGLTVELGSGSRRLRPGIVTVDLFASPNVDIVADIVETPLLDASIDNVILDSVIEHVPDPTAVVAEVRRILKPGGQIFINCPFMLPYHGYPKHYQNFTRDGLEHLLRDFSQARVRPAFGPMTAWTNMTAETFAVMVGGERGLAYVLAKGVAMLPIFWLKYLDALFVRAERSHRIAGMLCATAVRP